MCVDALPPVRRVALRGQRRSRRPAMRVAGGEVVRSRPDRCDRGFISGQGRDVAERKAPIEGQSLSIAR